MVTEVWFRNPFNYIRELVEVRATNIVWNKGTLVKRSIDPQSQAELYLQGLDYRLLIVGDIEQGAMELRRGHSAKRPWAVYPVWSYEDKFAVLEELLANPPGSDPLACGDMQVPVYQRPVLGQPPRVVITDMPSLSTHPGRRAAKQLIALKEDYPDSIIHIHGLYGYRSAFGLGFDSVDLEPRTAASKGKIVMPMGKEIIYERAGQFGQWLTLFGVTVGDLSVPRNRCIYNIKSALWAGEHYTENFRFRTGGPVAVNPDVPGGPPQTKNYRAGRATPSLPGDKFVCDTCSIQKSCKLYREGAVCTVQGAQSAELARMFGTRNAGMVIEGLHELLAVQARRLDRGVTNEDILDELDPEVTKIANSLFSNGVKLAKLLDPALSGGPKVGVFVNAGKTAQVAAGTPNAMVAGLVSQLEAQGIHRSKITPGMIQKLLTEDHENLAIAAGEALDVEEAD